MAQALVTVCLWQVDAPRYATIGQGDPARIALECAAFAAFTAVCFAIALRTLTSQE